MHQLLQAIVHSCRKNLIPVSRGLPDSCSALLYQPILHAAGSNLLIEPPYVRNAVGAVFDLIAAVLITTVHHLIAVNGGQHFDCHSVRPGARCWHGSSHIFAVKGRVSLGLDFTASTIETRNWPRGIFKLMIASQQLHVLARPNEWFDVVGYEEHA